MSKKAQIKKVQDCLAAGGVVGVGIKAEKLSVATNGGFRGNGWRATARLPEPADKEAREAIRHEARITSGVECKTNTFGPEPEMVIRAEGK